MFEASSVPPIRGSPRRLKEYSKSIAVSGVPSDHFRPGRSVNSSTGPFASGTLRTDCAAPGTARPLMSSV